MDNELKKLRERIDKLDANLLKTLARRFVVTEKVGEYKKTHNLPTTDRKREVKVLEHKKEISKQFGLNGEMSAKIFKIIMTYVKKRHKEIRERK